MKKLLLKIYLAYSIVVFCLIMTLSLPLVTLPFVLGERVGGRIAYFFLKAWGSSFGWLCGIWFRAVGRNKIDRKRTYVFVGNHNSYLDSPAFVTAIPGQFRPLGKAELKKVPVFGWLYPYVVIVVDRGSTASKLKSMRLLREKIKSGISVFLFPEGKMNQTAQPMLPFQDGAFRLAVETQTPIMPMVIINSRRLLPRDPFVLRPGVITTVFLKPVEVHGLTMADVPLLKQRVYDQMREALEEQEHYTSRKHWVLS